MATFGDDVRAIQDREELMIKLIDILSRKDRIENLINEYIHERISLRNRLYNIFYIIFQDESQGLLSS